MTDYLASVELVVSVVGGAELVRQSWPISKPDLGLYVVLPPGAMLDAEADAIWAPMPDATPSGDLEFTIRVAGYDASGDPLAGADWEELVADVWADARARGLRPREIRIHAEPRPAPFPGEAPA